MADNITSLVPMPSVTKPRRMPDFAEIGKTGIRRFSGRVYEEFLTQLQGLQGVRIYREMSDNDDIIGASLYAFERVVAQSSWYVQPNADDKASLKDADFLRDCMNDMEHSWSDFILEANSCLVYGWCICEEVYKIRKGQSKDGRLNSKFNDGLIGWRKLSRRMQSTLFEWDFADNGDIKGMVQCPPPDYDQLYIPLDKCTHFRTKLEGNNPEGRSILRNAYKPYYFKKNMQMLEAIGVERDLIGLPWIKPPEEFDIKADENAEVLAYIKNLLSNLRRDEQEGIFMPPGWEIQLLGSNTTRRQFDLDKIINRYDKRIAITVLAQFILLGMDRVGSFALSTNQNDLFKLAVQGYLNKMAETLNTYTIPRLFSYNPTLAKDHKYPKLVPGNISAPNLTELAAYINVLAKNGLLPTESKSLMSALLRLGRFFEANEDKIGEIYSTDAEKVVAEMPKTPKPTLAIAPADVNTNAKPKVKDNTNVSVKPSTNEG
jgi:hypothetical protein